jgi:hypothetical protein
MNKKLYNGPVPDGYIRITPKGEAGTVTIRAARVDMVIEAAVGGALVSLDGNSEIEFQSVIVGVAGGKPVSFKVEEPHQEIMRQLQEASYQIVMEQHTSQPEFFTADDSKETIH